MGVSAFPHTVNHPPEIERVARELSNLLNAASAAPLEERLRETCARLVDGMAVDAALLLVPSPVFPVITAGAGFVSDRTITDLLARPWLQSAIASSDVAVITGPPHPG